MSECEEEEGLGSKDKIARKTKMDVDSTNGWKRKKGRYSTRESLFLKKI